MGVTVTDQVEQLFSQARAGSVEAFYELVRHLQVRVRAYVRKFVLDRSSADDVAQETFFATYRSLAQYRSDVPVDLWILGIARNCALMHLRGESRRRAHEAQYLQSAVAEWSADRVESDSRLDRRARELSALKSCLKRLPEDSGRLVAAYYTERASSGEIAHKLGKKESAVRMALLRIRQALRECVQTRIVSLETHP